MKRVTFTKKYSFTKKEVVEALLMQFLNLTSVKELNKLVKRKHVAGYGQVYMDALNEYGSDIDEEDINELLNEFICNLANELGISDRKERIFVLDGFSNDPEKDQAILNSTVCKSNSCYVNEQGKLQFEYIGDYLAAKKGAKKMKN